MKELKEDIEKEKGKLLEEREREMKRIKKETKKKEDETEYWMRDLEDWREGILKEVAVAQEKIRSDN